MIVYYLKNEKIKLPFALTNITKYSHSRMLKKNRHSVYLYSIFKKNTNDKYVNAIKA